MRAVAVRRLASFKESAFLAGRFQIEDSYVVQAEALRALGRCGDKGQVPLLKEALGMRSPRDVVKRAAEAALRELGGN